MTMSKKSQKLPKTERLQKVLAHAGVASRRASETLIQQGRVSVNGQVVRELGLKVDPQRDVIKVDGKSLSKREQKPVYIILNKPRDILSAAQDERGRKTVLDLVNIDTRLYPVGRLDLQSEGLILLTNDGDLTQKLTHPSQHVEKEYHTLVKGKISTDALIRWRNGEIEIEGYSSDKPLAKAVVERMKIERNNTWLRIILTEGRKRQIRKVAKSLGYPVIALERVRIGPIRLGNLKSGKWRNLNSKEVEQLKRAVS